MLYLCEKWIRQSVRTLFRCSATWLRGKTTSPLNSWESRCKRVKRTKSKKNPLIVYLRTDYNCAMSRASLILKFNWSTLSAGESESDSNMKKSIVLVQRNDIEDAPPGATMAVSRPREVQRRSWRLASNDFEWLDKFFRLSWQRQCR